MRLLITCTNCMHGAASADKISTIAPLTFFDYSNSFPTWNDVRLRVKSHILNNWTWFFPRNRIIFKRAAEFAATCVPIVSDLIENQPGDYWWQMRACIDLTKCRQTIAKKTAVFFVRVCCARWRKDSSDNIVASADWEVIWGGEAIITKKEIDYFGPCTHTQSCVRLAHVYATYLLSLWYFVTVSPLFLYPSFLSVDVGSFFLIDWREGIWFLSQRKVANSRQNILLLWRTFFGNRQRDVLLIEIAIYCYCLLERLKNQAMIRLRWFTVLEKKRSFLISFFNAINSFYAQAQMWDVTRNFFNAF